MKPQNVFFPEKRINWKNAEINIKQGKVSQPY